MTQIRIKVLTGPEAGTVVEGAGRVTIGSASYCNLRLSGHGVLAVHAEVNATPQGLHLRSFSATGTRLNGAPVTEHYVSTDDQPEIGDGTRISIQMATAAAAARRPTPEAHEGPSRRSARPAPAAAPAPAGPPPNSFMGTLWRLRYIAAIYGIGLLLAAVLLVGDEADLAARFQAAGTAFAEEAAAARVAPEEAKARWSAVERAYSLERAGRVTAAIDEYVRLMVTEMKVTQAAGTKSPAWKFAAQRLAALRSES